MENKIYKLSDSEFIDLVRSSLNISEVLFKLGYDSKGDSWGYSKVKQRMTDLNLKGSDFRGKSPLKQSSEKPLDSLLVINSKHPRGTLRKSIIRYNLLPYKCAICGAVEWQGKTLSLELDHINGINNDNRIENLRFLCPNCHSQTDTYGSRNRAFTESKYDLSEEQSEKIVSEYIRLKNKKKVADLLGITQKAISQCLKENGISKPNQKYIIQYDKYDNELRRFGSISECCKWLISNNLVTTKKMKTCRTTLIKNAGILWKDYYFCILDA